MLNNWQCVMIAVVTAFQKGVRPEDVCLLLSGSQHSLVPHAVLLAQDKQLVQARQGLRARDGGADWLSRTGLQTKAEIRNPFHVPGTSHTQRKLLP